MRRVETWEQLMKREAAKAIIESAIRQSDDFKSLLRDITSDNAPTPRELDAMHDAAKRIIHEAP